MYPIDLLPSPFYLFNDALSILQSLQASRRRSPAVHPTPVDFDVNLQTNTGFLPSQPLPKLQEPFSIWEDALSEAPKVLKLGEDLLEDDLRERSEGELWRQRIRSVSLKTLKEDTRANASKSSRCFLQNLFTRTYSFSAVHIKS